MNKSKLIESLGYLEVKEYKRFFDFISSPFFNKDSASVKLFETVKPLIKTPGSKLLNKELIFSKMYPGKNITIKL